MLLRSLALCLLCACSELGLPTPPGRPAGNVSVEPSGELDRAPAVLRLRVGGGLGRSALQDFRLFEGELSAYHLGRIRSRELPSTLLAREIELVTWLEPPDVMVAPTRALASGTVSLATPELGLVAEVTVDATLSPWLARRWPPPASRRGSGLAVFCGTDVALATEGTLVLAPSGLVADARFGLDDAGSFADSCLRLEPRGSGEPGVPSLPPARLGAVLLEPRPLVAEETEAPAPGCVDGEVALGPACVRVDDDRLTFGTYGAPSLWAFEAPARLLGVVDAGASLVVRGLLPDRSVRVLATVFDELGARRSVDATLRTAASHAHVVLNEVLANPAGAEATSEWIELVNDGSSAVDLAGFTLSDAGGTVTLPSLALAAGDYVLLVDQEFDPDPALDLLPAEGTRVVRLPELGDAGLSNTGEPLRLRDAGGRLSSLFPSLPGRRAGHSVARRTPEAGDADTLAFAEHAEPGASPGAPNVLPDP